MSMRWAHGQDVRAVLRARRADRVQAAPNAKLSRLEVTAGLPAKCKEVADPTFYGGMHVFRRTANPVTDDGAQACIRRKGLIRMRPRSNTYAVTSHGIWVAIFYTNVYGRLLRPLLALDYAQLPQKAAKHSVSSTPRRHLDPWRPYSQSSMTNLTPLFRRPEQRPEARARVDSFRARGRQS